MTIETSLSEFKERLGDNRRMMALDYGERKVGIAFSDMTGTIASAYDVYERQNMRKDIGYLGKLTRDEGVVAIVIGLPLALDGEENDHCQMVRSFAKKLQDKTGLPILLQDERFSTAAATRALQEDSITRKKRQQLDDKVAAAFLLQTVLDGV